MDQVKTSNKPRKQLTEITNYLTLLKALKENDPPAPISSIWLSTKPIPHTILKPKLCTKTLQFHASSTSFTSLALTSNINSSIVKKSGKKLFIIPY